MLSSAGNQGTTALGSSCELESPGKRKSQLGSASIDRPVCKSLIIFMVIGSCGKTQPTEGGASPGMVVLVSMRKQDDQVQRNMPISTFLCGLCFTSCLEFLA